MNKKRMLSIVFNIGITLCAALCLYFLYGFMQPGILRNVLTCMIIFAVVIAIIYELKNLDTAKKKIKKRDPPISALILLSKDDRPIRVWDLTGKVGLLIGKSSDEYQVDIDLSDTDYHTYIDCEHAILNYHQSGWWITDTSTRNGINIIRNGKEITPSHSIPAKIEPGDIINIAHYTRIGVN